jgi:transposase, IS5 family
MLSARLLAWESTQVVCRVTGELADPAEQRRRRPLWCCATASPAAKALSGPVRGRLRRALGELAVTIERAQRIVARAGAVWRGRPPERDPAGRLHDPDARPIRKGRIDKPVEFGYKAQVVDNDDGIVLDYTVECGNVADRGDEQTARVRWRGGHGSLDTNMREQTVRLIRMLAGPVGA